MDDTTVEYCEHNHSDPNDHPSNKHIARCFAAWREYWDRDGLTTFEEFCSRSVAEKHHELVEFGNSDYQTDEELYD